MEPETKKKDHVLKKWMKRKRITGAVKIKETFGVTQAVFTHIYNGNRVSDSLLATLELNGVPMYIINILKKQGV